MTVFYRTRYMDMAFEKLIKFDLIEDLEKSFFRRGNSDSIVCFFNTIQQIQSIDQFIKDAPSFPGSTDKIIRSELVSAIGATLAIEGTRLGEEEIEESFRKADLKESLRRKEQEAENSRIVYQFITDLVTDNKGEFVYTEAMIKQIHKFFTENMNYLGNKPGEYRGEYAATFGEPRRKGLCRTNSEVEVAMQSFIKWLNDQESGPICSNSIVKSIMSHYYLTEIHPFADGNGRTARALEALVLYINGINSYCFWSLANFWSTHKDEYIIHLGNIRNTCNPWDFLIWGMKGYLDEIKRIKARVLKKVKQLMLMDYTKYLLDAKKRHKVKINQRIVDVLRLLVRVDRIPFNKFQVSPEVEALYKNVSAATKYRDFKKMVSEGLIKLEKEGDVFIVEPNYQILEYVIYNV